MSALATASPPFSYPRLVAVALREIAPRPARTIEQAAIPCPPSLRQYLRGDSDAEYARLLRAIFAAGRPYGRSPLAGTFDPRGAAMAALRRQLDADPSDDAATPLVLALVTPVPCPTCRAPFIRYTARTIYCQRRCGALAAAVRQVARLRAARKETAANGG